jgi:hypothetical protein
VLGEGIASQTQQRAIAASVQVTDRSMFKLLGEVSWRRLMLQCNGRSETELVPKASSGRASGLNGQVSVDQNSDTADFGLAVFIQLRLIVLKLEVSQFLFEDTPSCNCPDLESSNISKDGKNLYPVAGVNGCTEQEGTVTGCVSFSLR